MTEYIQFSIKDMGDSWRVKTGNFSFMEFNKTSENPIIRTFPTEKSVNEYMNKYRKGIFNRAAEWSKFIFNS